MLQKSARAKGKNFEKEWSEILRSNHLDLEAERNPSSGAGFTKGDVYSSLPYHFECKKVEKLNIWKAIEQAERDSSLSNKIPCVVISRNFLKEPWVVLPSSEWIKLESYRKASNLKEYSHQLKWKIANAIKILKELLKEFE